MKIKKHSSLSVVVLTFLLLVSFTSIATIMDKKDEILEMEVNYSFSGLPAIVYADSETINDIDIVEANVVFEDLSEKSLIQSRSIEIENSCSDLELVVSNIETSVKESFAAAGHEYIDDIFEASQIQKVEYRWLNFIYDQLYLMLT